MFKNVSSKICAGPWNKKQTNKQTKNCKALLGRIMEIFNKFKKNPYCKIGGIDIDEIVISLQIYHFQMQSQCVWIHPQTNIVIK